jgi:protein gp37
MGKDSKIEWTEATWNPMAGCSIVSPGCRECYAMRRVAPRLAANPATPHYAGTVQKAKTGYVWTGKLGLSKEKLTEPLRTKNPTMWFVNSTSDLFHEGAPDEWIAEVFGVMAVAGAVGAFHRKEDGCRTGPSWTASDGREVPTKWPNMHSGPHTFQVLTKRSGRMRALLNSASFRQDVAGAAHRHAMDRTPASQLSDAIEDGRAWPLPNVWMGVSAEDQPRADERIPDLLVTPAAVRFVSAEPLLGPIRLTSIMVPEKANRHDGPWSLRWDALGGFRATSPYSGTDGNPRLDWVIIGGESGKNARPMHPQWARDLRDQCKAAGVPFFFKQWGEWAANVGALDGFAIDDNPEISRFDHREWEGDHWSEPFRPMWCDFTDGSYDQEQCVSRVGKKAAGRLLDGVEHNGFPEARR